MWTELFQRAAPCPSEQVGGPVGHVDAPAPPNSVPGSTNTGICPGIATERALRVDLCKVDTIDISLPLAVPMTARAATGVLPVTLSVSPGMASIASTDSTLSTAGKYCRLLTAAEKYELMELFRLDLVLLDMRASLGGLLTADELWRTNTVAWRLATVEGMTFEAAMLAAARWVAGNLPHPDEQGFVDILALYRKGVL